MSNQFTIKQLYNILKEEMRDGRGHYTVFVEDVEGFECPANNYEVYEHFAEFNIMSEEG